MQLQEIKDELQEAEIKLSEAIDAEQYDDAKQLIVKTQDLLKQLATVSLKPEEVEDFKAYANAYISHIHEQVAKLEVVKNSTRDEIVKLTKGAKNRKAYVTVRRDGYVSRKTPNAE